MMLRGASVSGGVEIQEIEETGPGPSGGLWDGHQRVGPCVCTHTQVHTHANTIVLEHCVS